MAKKFIDLDGLEHIWSKIKSNFLSLTGDQTVAGEKTFTTTPIVENSAPSVRCINTALTKGTNPSTLSISNSGWFDKNSKWLGYYGYQVEIDGEARSYLGVYEFDSASDSAENRTSLGVAYPKNGTPYAFAPSTPSGATSNEIATAGWIAGNFVDLSSAQTVGGGKTWTGNQNVKKSAPYISFQNTGVTKGTAPSATATSTITFGSNGGTNAANSLAMLQNSVDTSGNNIVKLSAYDPTASSTTNASLQITYPKGGTPTLTWKGKDISNPITGASISGQVITLTFADGTTQTLTTQDTNGISNQSLAQNGYTTLGNGLIMQWGRYSMSSGADLRKPTITFPKAFTSACYSVTISDSLVPGGSYSEFVNTTGVYSATKTNFTVVTGHGEASTIWFIAFGK